MGNDNLPIIVGGVIAVGGIGFGVYEWWKRNQQAEKVKELNEKVTELQGLINEYIEESNTLIAKFNRVAEKGSMTPEEQAEIEREEAILSQLELEIGRLQDEINRLKEETGSTIDTPSLEDRLFNAGLIIVSVIVAMKLLPDGLKVAKMVVEWVKSFRNRQGPPPSASCPKCGASVGGATMDEQKQNMQTHLIAYHAIASPSVIAEVIPSAQAQFEQLPLWVQDSLAVEAGIETFYLSPDWTPQIQIEPWRVYTIIAAFIVLAFAVVLLAPEVGPLVVNAGRALVPALAY